MIVNPHDQRHTSNISERFAGQRPVARQQSVYATLNATIASGDIHAVNLQTFTPGEWQAAQG